MKTVGGGLVGVIVPLGSEYILKGGRAFADPAIAGSGYKYSGIIGLVEGGVGIAVAMDKMPGIKLSSEDDKQMAAALGGAGLATGAGILILDEMRKRAAYTFQRSQQQRLRESQGRVPLRSPRAGLEEETRFERIVEPVTPLVEEV